MHSPLLGKSTHAFRRCPRVTLDQFSLLEKRNLPIEAVPISPRFIRRGEVAEGRPHEHVGGPEQEVQKLFSFRSHEDGKFEGCVQPFVSAATKGCSRHLLESRAARLLYSSSARRYS